MNTDLTTAITEVIADRRMVAGNPANAFGIPAELIEEMESSGLTTFESLTERFAHRIDELIAEGF